MKIRRAQPEDAAALTQIALAAKRHWGYPESWITHWTEALTITPDYIGAHPTFVARTDDEIVGFYALKIQSAVAFLDHLWVLPTTMGQGVGRALFAHAEETARAAGVTCLKIVGDPHAEGFYVRVGAKVYGRELAIMEGHVRYLPLLEKSL